MSFADILRELAASKEDVALSGWWLDLAEKLKSVARRHEHTYYVELRGMYDRALSESVVNARVQFMRGQGLTLTPRMERDRDGGEYQDGWYISWSGEPGNDEDSPDSVSKEMP